MYVYIFFKKRNIVFPIICVYISNCQIIILSLMEITYTEYKCKYAKGNNYTFPS